MVALAPAAAVAARGFESENDETSEKESAGADAAGEEDSHTFAQVHMGYIRRLRRDSTSFEVVALLAAAARSIERTACHTLHSCMQLELVHLL